MREQTCSCINHKVYRRSLRLSVAYITSASKKAETLENLAWKIRLVRGCDLSFAEPLATLGRANAVSRVVLRGDGF